MADTLFVTKEDCSKVTNALTMDMKQIKTALIGEDMRGGIVKDVADTKKDIAEIKADIANQNGNNRESLGRKEKAMIYCAVIAASSMIVVELVKAIV